jgi:hypothetical protein
MRTVIPGLLNTPTFDLSVTVHSHHRDTEGGICGACGRRSPCPARCSAAAVIVAAGADPRTCQQSQPARVSSTRSAQPDFEVTGFAISGRTRPLSPAGFTYERDAE